MAGETRTDGKWACSSVEGKGGARGSVLDSFWVAKGGNTNSRAIAIFQGEKRCTLGTGRTEDLGELAVRWGFTVGQTGGRVMTEVDESG